MVLLVWQSLTITHRFPMMVTTSLTSLSVTVMKFMTSGFVVDNPRVIEISNEKRRFEATAIVMLGVIGAEFGKEIEPKRISSGPTDYKRGSVEGFGLANHSLALHTSKTGRHGQS